MILVIVWTFFPDHTFKVKSMTFDRETLSRTTTQLYCKGLKRTQTEGSFPAFICKYMHTVFLDGLFEKVPVLLKFRNWHWIECFQIWKFGSNCVPSWLNDHSHLCSWSDAVSWLGCRLIKVSPNSGPNCWVLANAKLSQHSLSSFNANCLSSGLREDPMPR